MRPRLFWNILTVEARKRMSYRADFWINSVAGILVSFSVFWFLTWAMFAAARQSNLGGFTPRGMVLYYVFAIVMGKIVQSNEMDMGIAQDIYDGSLSRYLIYPVPYAAVKFAQQAGWLAPQVVQMILFGSLGPVIVGMPPGIHITPASVMMGMGSLALANLLHYLITLPIHAVAFWADNVWSLMVAERLVISFLGGLMLPLSLFPERIRQLLFWTPFPYLFSVPVRAVMGRVSVTEWAAGLAIAGVWCGVAALAGHWVWRRGDWQYTGVGI